MDRECWDVIIIGGGASGITASVFAARKGCKVLVLEQKEIPCKKINATGNGKCNFTNRVWKKADFRGNHPELAFAVLERFPLENTLSFFREIGIYPKERNGYFYPNSEQASSVSRALLKEAERFGVNLLVNHKVTDLKKNASGTYLVSCGKEQFLSKSVVLATGGKASPVHGSDGSGYPFAKTFGLRLAPVLPAIVQLQGEGYYFEALAGVRTDGKITLHVEDEQYSESGELLFASYGISGIPVMQVSRYASAGLYEGKNVNAELDLFPGLSEQDLLTEISQRMQRFSLEGAANALNGLCNTKLAAVLLSRVGISKKESAGNITNEIQKELVYTMKHFCFKITATNGFENAQACAGGVLLSELNSNLESEKNPGLFVIGELADVDGNCGGYNLQWAWSSGAVVGKELADRYGTD